MFTYDPKNPNEDYQNLCQKVQDKTWQDHIKNFDMNLVIVLLQTLIAILNFLIVCLRTSQAKKIILVISKSFMHFLAECSVRVSEVYKDVSPADSLKISNASKKIKATWYTRTSNKQTVSDYTQNIISKLIKKETIATEEPVVTEEPIKEPVVTEEPIKEPVVTKDEKPKNDIEFALEIFKNLLKDGMKPEKQTYEHFNKILKDANIFYVTEDKQFLEQFLKIRDSYK